MSFGERLKKARERKGESLRFVSDRTGIHNVTLSNYENDKTQPNLETIVKLVDYYHVSIDYLFERTDNPNPISDYGDITQTAFAGLTPEQKCVVMDMIEHYRNTNAKLESATVVREKNLFLPTGEAKKR